MIDALKILRWETVGFLDLLSAILAYRILTRSIPLNGLFLRKDGSGRVSPERVQLLVATLTVSAKYFGAVIHSTGASMPKIDPGWIWVFGASSGIYMSAKAVLTLRNK